MKGLVLSLFTVKDLCNAKALEAVARGKLYNIVVDTEVSLLCYFETLNFEIWSYDLWPASMCLLTECLGGVWTHVPILMGSRKST